VSDYEIFRFSGSLYVLNDDYIKAGKRIKELRKEVLELILNKNSMIIQVKNRVPIEISKKIGSWPQCLTAIAQLKQERNNADIDLVEKEKELQKYRDVVEAAKESISFDSVQYIYDKENGYLDDRFVPLVNLMEALNQLEGESE